jgi:hypothetical protein
VISTTLLNAEFDRICRIIRDEISEMEVCSITTDGWTSRQRFGYQCLTTHSCTKDFVLKKRAISLQNIPGSHTSEVLQRYIVDKLRSWNLLDKVECITTDNGNIRSHGLLTLNLHSLNANLCVY